MPERMGTPSGEGRDYLMILFSITEPAPAPSPKKVTATQGTQTEEEPALTSELFDWIDWSTQPGNESEILRYQISQQEQSLLSLLDDPGEGPSTRGDEQIYNREGAWNVFVGADGAGDQAGVLVTVDRVLREGEEGALEPELWLSCGESLEEPREG